MIKELYISWRTRSYDAIHKIQDHFGWPRGFTVNYRSWVQREPTEEQWQELRELESKGWLTTTYLPVTLNRLAFMNNATENFVKVIGEYIEREKKADEMFAKCVDEQPQKTIEGCMNYILKTVRESKIAGWTDDEIYGMAKHFYDEKNITDPGKMKGARVVVNHAVELTDEEKAQAKADALAKFQAEEREKLERREAKKKEKERKRIEQLKKEVEERAKAQPVLFQPSLFD